MAERANGSSTCPAFSGIGIGYLSCQAIDA